MSKPLPHKPPRFYEQLGEFLYSLPDHDEIVKAEVARERACSEAIRTELAQLKDAFVALQAEHTAAMVQIAQLRRENHALVIRDATVAEPTSKP